jgi:hypothetical protein
MISAEKRIQLFDADEVEIGGRKFQYTCIFGKRNTNGSASKSTPAQKVQFCKKMVSE